MRFRTSLLIVMAVGLVAASVVAEENKVPQDEELLRYMSRALAWCPDSTFEVVDDERRLTPSGAYRIVQVERKCMNQFLSGITGVVLDEPGKKIWFGSVTTLPASQLEGDEQKIKTFIGSTLPDLVYENMGTRIEVSWDVDKGKGPSTIMPFEMRVESGYGTYTKTAGVTIDGVHLLMGAPMPYDRDPVEYRVELFETSPLVVWDRRSESAKVKIVEFSDLECPGCRVKWPLIKSAIAKHGEAVAHGMVNFPLPSIHPWAFRAASAAWCVAKQDPEALVEFKELFYGLQQDMELSMVTGTSIGYLEDHGLDVEGFRACYLKAESIDAVHGQMQLGDALSIRATPTYFVNGWLVQVPNVAWFPQLIDRIVAGEDP